jgi:hypothetical protein
MLLNFIEEVPRSSLDKTPDIHVRQYRLRSNAITSQTVTWA